MNLVCALECIRSSFLRARVEKNLLCLGTANRSESFVGWFIKDGIDDFPIEAILGLYKNQVYQLARFLKVSEEILKEAPSPDMYKGMGDEDLIGYSFQKIDRVAYVLEHGLRRSCFWRRDNTERI